MCTRNSIYSAAGLRVTAGSGRRNGGTTWTPRLMAGHGRVSDGDVVIGREVVTDLPPARRGTAMMFQSYALFPHLSVVDNVAFSLQMRGTAKASRRQRAMAMLKLVHM